MLLTLNHAPDSCALLQILSPQQPKQRAICRQKRGFVHTLPRAAVYSPPHFIFPQLCFVLGQTYFQTEVLQVNVTLLNLTGLGLYYAETITEANDSLKYSSSGALHLAVSPVRVFAPRLSISRSGLYLFLSLAFRSQRYRVLFRRAAEFVQDVSN